MFGAELWWRGDLAEGTIGRGKEFQLLVNREARATTGCFRTTSLRALSMESGLRAATAQLENRQRRFGLRLLSLPEGEHAREVVGAPTEIGRRLKKLPRTRWTDREDSAARGAGNPRRGATAGGGSRGKSGGRGDPTGPHHVHGRVMTGRWGDRVLGGVEEGPNLGGGQSAHGQQPRSL